ncbi:hypothetical protein KCP73_10185 [Salmonella enterica subsp. enterica]|nr:hypothetical protein KCP73_10185 [Salmonella enterica subsp. enterica]
MILTAQRYLLVRIYDNWGAAKATFGSRTRRRLAKTNDYPAIINAFQLNFAAFMLPWYAQCVAGRCANVIVPAQSSSNFASLLAKYVAL